VEGNTRLLLVQATRCSTLHRPKKRGVSSSRWNMYVQ
jgi:hypothetical protein